MLYELAKFLSVEADSIYSNCICHLQLRSDVCHPSPPFSDVTLKLNPVLMEMPHIEDWWDQGQSLTGTLSGSLGLKINTMF